MVAYTDANQPSPTSTDSALARGMQALDVSKPPSPRSSKQDYALTAGDPDAGGFDLLVKARNAPVFVPMAQRQPSLPQLQFQKQPQQATGSRPSQRPYGKHVPSSHSRDGDVETASNSSSAEPGQISKPTTPQPRMTGYVPPTPQHDKLSAEALEEKMARMRQINADMAAKRLASESDAKAYTDGIEAERKAQDAKRARLAEANAVVDKARAEAVQRKLANIQGRAWDAEKSPVKKPVEVAPDPTAAEPPAPAPKSPAPEPTASAPAFKPEPKPEPKPVEGVPRFFRSPPPHLPPSHRNSGQIHVYAPGPIPAVDAVARSDLMAWGTPCASPAVPGAVPASQPTPEQPATQQWNQHAAAFQPSESQALAPTAGAPDSQTQNGAPHNLAEPQVPTASQLPPAPTSQTVVSPPVNSTWQPNLQPRAEAEQSNAYQLSPAAEPVTNTLLQHSSAPVAQSGWGTTPSNPIDLVQTCPQVPAAPSTSQQVQATTAAPCKFNNADDGGWGVFDPLAQIKANAASVASTQDDSFMKPARPAAAQSVYNVIGRRVEDSRWAPSGSEAPIWRKNLQQQQQQQQQAAIREANEGVESNANSASAPPVQPLNVTSSNDWGSQSAPLAAPQPSGDQGWGAPAPPAATFSQQVPQPPTTTGWGPSTSQAPQAPQQQQQQPPHPPSPSSAPSTQGGLNQPSSSTGGWDAAAQPPQPIATQPVMTAPSRAADGGRRAPAPAQQPPASNGWNVAPQGAAPAPQPALIGSWGTPGAVSASAQGWAEPPTSAPAQGAQGPQNGNPWPSQPQQSQPQYGPPPPRQMYPGQQSQGFAPQSQHGQAPSAQEPVAAARKIYVHPDRLGTVPAAGVQSPASAAVQVQAPPPTQEFGFAGKGFGFGRSTCSWFTDFVGGGKNLRLDRDESPFNRRTSFGSQQPGPANAGGANAVPLNGRRWGGSSTGGGSPAPAPTPERPAYVQAQPTAPTNAWGGVYDAPPPQSINASW